MTPKIPGSRWKRHLKRKLISQHYILCVPRPAGCFLDNIYYKATRFGETMGQRSFATFYCHVNVSLGNQEISFKILLKKKRKALERRNYLFYYKISEEKVGVTARKRITSNTYKEASSRKRGERSQQSWVKIRRVRKNQLFLFLQGSQTL